MNSARWVNNEAVANHEEIELVDSVLTQLVDALKAHKVERVLQLFRADAVLYGSEVGQEAEGGPELRKFFTEFVARPETYGWTWETPRAVKRGEIVFFIAPAVNVITWPDGSQTSRPYRLSGMLEKAYAGHWEFSFFNGAEPVPSRVGSFVE